MTGMVLLTLTLLWQFNRQFEPAPEHFVISYTSSLGQTIEQMQVTPSTVDQCAGLPTADHNTYCADWPTCPAPSIVIFWVQAQRGDSVSKLSNLLACQFTAAQPCVCIPTDQVPPPDGIGNGGDDGGSPGPILPPPPPFRPIFPTGAT